jgi:hypothetical protein
MENQHEEFVELPARSGCSVFIKKDQRLKIVNTHGNQVVDTWALNANEITEFMSMAQTRRMLWKLWPQEGDSLFSNRRTSMLIMERDTSPGIHDTLFDCCDEWVYANYGCPPGHPNCRDNFKKEVAALISKPMKAPQPLNLWMNAPVSENMRLEVVSPVSKPGDFIILHALMDVWVIMSACPMDVTPVNGENCQPVEVHYRVIGS